MNNIITLDGHAEKALNFYNDVNNVYFVIGKTSVWDDEANPPEPNEDSIIEEVIGYKKVDQIQIILPDDDGDIIYKGNIYRAIKAGYEYYFLNEEALIDTNELKLTETPTLIIEAGDKVRLNRTDIYTVTSYDPQLNIITVDDSLTETYSVNTLIEIGSVVEGGKLIYIKGTIAYDELPIQEFRQVGLTIGLIKNEGVPEGQKALLPDDVNYSGILNIIENRTVVERAIDQRETLAMIIEF